MIKKENGKYVVYSKSGKKFGEYSLEEDAKNRIRQMEMFKHMKKVAYINKLIPKALKEGKILRSGIADVDSAVMGGKYLYNKLKVGKTSRDAYAKLIKSSRGAARTIVSKTKEANPESHFGKIKNDAVAFNYMKAKEGYNSARKMAPNIAGRAFAEPDLPIAVAAGKHPALIASPVPVATAYIGARHKVKKGVKTYKKFKKNTDDKPIKYLLNNMSML